MSNVSKPWSCPICHSNRATAKALYIRDKKKGWQRIGWLFACGHVKLDEKETG